MLFLGVLRDTGGNFTYTMDDPYIHLALAKNIWHGNYGLNVTELSAPASSILWPFLMAPFAASPRLFEYVPLIVNVLCLLGSAFCLDRILSDLSAVKRAFLTFVILLSLNAYGLVFTGMEHSLQVLLVLVILRSLFSSEQNRQDLAAVDRLAFASVILLPLVRYEGLAISLPCIACLYMKGRRQQAVVLLGTIVISLGLFSLFLYSKGLGFLPSSIMLKASPGSAASAYGNLLLNIRQYGFLIIPVAFLVSYHWTKNRDLALVLLTATILHFVFGKYGWVGRYEVYYLFLIIVTAVRTVIQIPVPNALAYVALLPLCFWTLVDTTITSPAGAGNIFHQQGQMARIGRLLGESIAANDLGLLSLRSGQYVLDIAGLSSLESLKAIRTGQDPNVWITRMMDEKGVRFACVYDEWYPKLPDKWLKGGELRLLELRITPASSVVSFYATSEPAREKLRQVLREFSSRFPSRAYEIRVF